VIQIHSRLVSRFGLGGGSVSSLDSNYEEVSETAFSDGINFLLSSAQSSSAFVCSVLLPAEDDWRASKLKPTFRFTFWHYLTQKLISKD